MIPNPKPAPILPKPEQQKQIQVDPEEYFDFEKIIGVQVRQGKTMYKVKWKGDYDATWEPVENLGPNDVQEYHRTHTKQGKKRKQKPSRYFRR